MSQESAIAAADEATCLSHWLENSGAYREENLYWLTAQHMEKFRLAIDADETKN